MPAVPVLIPALNCGATIAAVVASVREHGAEVLVVSDGSTDDTDAQAAAAGAEVIRHPTTSGKGAALLTGMRAFARRGRSHVLTMDGDGQHLASQMQRVLEASAAAPQALVIGVRRLDAVPTTRMKRFGNHFANRWVQIACGQCLPDTQSGFRVYPVASTLVLGLRAHHFAFETEVLVRAARAGIPIRSVPVEVYYPPVQERVSHFHPVIDTVRIVFVVLGLIFHIW